jgi:hypothetical protein
MSTTFSSHFSKGLHIQTTDNEDEDYPPEFTTLANEIEKCKLKLACAKFGSIKFYIYRPVFECQHYKK